MPRKRVRSNPPWSWQFLDYIWDDLLIVGGPKMMPILSNPRRNPVVHDYGEGYWGVAMPCVDRKWTLKLTTDRSEAHFVALLHGLGLASQVQGLVRTTDAFNTERKVPRNSVNVPVYLYWREAVEFMGDEAWAYMKAHAPEHRFVHARNVIIDALNRARIDGATLDDAAAGIAKLTGAKLTRVAGAELRALSDDGILVTDVNLNNWGILPRAPDQLTMVDPGLVRYSEAAKALSRQHPPRSLREAAQTLARA